MRLNPLIIREELQRGASDAIGRVFGLNPLIIREELQLGNTKLILETPKVLIP